ncbi:hypothetical protein ACFQY7_52725 [Actinomadura luteofluorescens]|uniref:hypothetical protein n=1 Tax=Actinomadura luteofluorescens TaxID=46163 RepID=UPI0036355125
MRARITAVAAHLPDRTVSSAEVEARVAAESPGYRPHPTIVERMTGIRSRHVMRDDEQASDLAVAAARRALAERAVEPTAWTCWSSGRRRRTSWSPRPRTSSPPSSARPARSSTSRTPATASSTGSRWRTR